MWHKLTWHTHLIHYMGIHIVPVYQLLNDLELAITTGQMETVCIILCTYEVNDTEEVKKRMQKVNMSTFVPCP